MLLVKSVRILVRAGASGTGMTSSLANLPRRLGSRLSALLVAAMRITILGFEDEDEVEEEDVAEEVVVVVDDEEDEDEE